jgi:glycyl-tRNA synthetase
MVLSISHILDYFDFVIGFPIKLRMRSSSTAKSSMENILNLCKRRGFVFQSAEIYNPLGGFYDFGPLGVELKKNIKDIWWKNMVHQRKDIYGLDSSIISSPQIWKASGHIDGFSDPMVDCYETKQRFRADQVFWSPVFSASDESLLGYISLEEGDDVNNVALQLAVKLAKSKGYTGNLLPLELQVLTAAPEEIYHLLPSPVTGRPGLTRPREFNLMFATNVGAIVNESSTSYLRPETAQVDYFCLPLFFFFSFAGVGNFCEFSEHSESHPSKGNAFETKKLSFNPTLDTFWSRSNWQSISQ